MPDNPKPLRRPLLVSATEECQQAGWRPSADVYRTRRGWLVKFDLAGEITLAGLVLPVGGIKEKVLAARRSGFQRIILPKQNEQDLGELPELVRRELECDRRADRRRDCRGRAGAGRPAFAGIGLVMFMVAPARMCAPDPGRWRWTIRGGIREDRAMKNCWKLALALVALGLVSFGQDQTGQHKQEKKPKEELALLQGRWSMTTRSPDGKALRIEKEVKDRHETVTVFGPDEKVQYAFEADFMLDKVSRARMFTWTNRVITVGPRKGRKVPDGGYVYTVREGRWICALGLLEDDPLPMQLQVFEPVKDKSI